MPAPRDIDPPVRPQGISDSRIVPPAATEIRVEKPVTEDLFEAARRAFFGTAKVVPEPSPSPAPSHNTRGEPSQGGEPPAVSSDEREETHPLIPPNSQ